MPNELNSFMVIILLCALVTWVPRVLPFIVVNKLKLPASVVRSLKFIPVCLFTSIVISMLIQPIQDADKTTHLVIHWDMIFACIPTLLVAIWTKSLAKSVLIGIVCLYLIRLFF